MFLRMRALLYTERFCMSVSISRVSAHAALLHAVFRSPLPAFRHSYPAQTLRIAQAWIFEWVRGLLKLRVDVRAARRTDNSSASAAALPPLLAAQTAASFARSIAAANALLPAAAAAAGLLSVYGVAIEPGETTWKGKLPCV